ncbi:LytR/AlgR family response regulator transcription factor [Clostridium pasteurianum]|uniref:Stage 0 sporulation protein A homolog n=1 Tax=Clostridium pasteurianum BC1 TaxID=86416 RepID=R4JYY7_CLOPA|nr:LytTR family DNA-binding domain-containing protein [Clostridium pasteurianum]AGK96017.1 response regulator of the LytR/AlgR family [Clostridium pasteurianum BC1]
MMDIIICEDNNAQRIQIENIIIEEINSSNLDLNITLSTFNPKQVIEYISNSKNTNFIYFLDVELNSDINGIELATIIRKYDPKGYIIFVTSHAELTLLTFEYKVQAMDYILKYNSENLKVKIIECLRAAYNNFKRLENIEKKYISIDIGHKIVNLQPEQILFFETDKDHRIRLHTFDENIEFYCSLKQIEIIVPPHFYKCHRSYIVNTRNIKSIDKDNLTIYMINGDKCYVSKRYMKGMQKNV